MRTPQIECKRKNVIHVFSELLNAKVTVIELILNTQLTKNVIRESNLILFSEYKDRIEPLLVGRGHLFTVLMAKR